jgi:hypothetical protein
MGVYIPGNTATGDWRIVIFTENISQRKNGATCHKESEERFRTMANEAPLFVWETDENCKLPF